MGDGVAHAELGGEGGRVDAVEERAVALGREVRGGVPQPLQDVQPLPADGNPQHLVPLLFVMVALCSPLSRSPERPARDFHACARPESPWTTTRARPPRQPGPHVIDGD